MGDKMSFKEVVSSLLDRYRNTSLPMRYKEGIMPTPNLEPSAYWIRESSDLVNIVWLTDSDVRDITWFPDDQSSSLNIVRYSAVLGYQIREADDAGKSHGLRVTGNYVVSIYASGRYGTLYWVANDRRAEEELRKFVIAFSKKLG